MIFYHRVHRLSPQDNYQTTQPSIMHDHFSMRWRLFYRCDQTRRLISSQDNGIPPNNSRWKWNIAKKKLLDRKGHSFTRH